jgi:hypothetical protein
MQRVRVWDLPSQEPITPLEIVEDLTSTLVDTTITYIGAFKIVRLKHYLLRYGWIFLAIGCLGLMLASLAI